MRKSIDSLSVLGPSIWNDTLSGCLFCFGNRRCSENRLFVLPSDLQPIHGDSSIVLDVMLIAWPGI